MLANVLSFFLPQLWEVGCKPGIQAEQNFFVGRYGSKYLAGFGATVGPFVTPNVQLQPTGMGIIVTVASFEGHRQEVISS